MEIYNDGYGDQEILLTEVTVDVLVNVACKYDEQKVTKLNPGGLFDDK